MRYVWDQYEAYFGDARGLKKALVSRMAGRLRAWDRASASRVHRFVAISRFVRERIAQSYGVDREQVDVLFAPADLTGLSPPPAGATREDRYLVVSALVPYKRVEVAVEACARGGRRLTVAGSGPELGRLRKLAEQLGAADRVAFVGHVGDAQIARLMQTHRAFLFPGVEDFGLTPLEAAASGMPVIGLARGGILDTMIDGVTAQLYDDPSVAGLAAAIERFERDAHPFDPAVMRTHAEQFSPRAFADRMIEICERTLRAHGAGCVPEVV
jgi:glycosyltransferase involved in cell wall biosynthesis